MADQCHGVCTHCGNWCSLSSGHYGQCQCSNGHRWS